MRCIVITILTFYSIIANAQQKAAVPLQLKWHIINNVINKKTVFPNKPHHTITPKSTAINLMVSPNHYTKSFGIFCRSELQFEKRTGIPLRFRLGSLAHCNYLEGK
jgi:hypothetical protein